MTIAVNLGRKATKQYNTISQDTVRIQPGYSKDTVRIQQGYSQGTAGVQSGYIRDTVGCSGYQ